MAAFVALHGASFCGAVELWHMECEDTVALLVANV
jgi:hypothetical protein